MISFLLKLFRDKLNITNIKIYSMLYQFKILNKITFTILDLENKILNLKKTLSISILLTNANT